MNDLHSIVDMLQPAFKLCVLTVIK